MSEISCPTFCSNQGHQWALISLLRELSSLVFKTFKNRDHTTSLGYLSACMIVLVSQNILLASSLNLCFNICCLSPILWHMPLCWVWLQFPEELFVRTGRLLLGPLKASLSAGWASSTPRPLLTELGLQPQPLQWPLQNPSSLILSLYWGGQNWTQGYKCDLLGAEQRGIITSLDLLAALLFIQTKMLLDIFVARGCGCFMCSLLFTRTSGPFWQGCSPASTTAVFKAWNNCLVYLNTDYKGNGYKKSAKAPIPWCVQRLQPRFCSE